MKKDKIEIKGYFNTGDKPTQQQYHDTWDSFWHKDEALPIENVETPDLDQILTQGNISTQTIKTEGFSLDDTFDNSEYVIKGGAAKVAIDKDGSESFNINMNHLSEIYMLTMINESGHLQSLRFNPVNVPHQLNLPPKTATLPVEFTDGTTIIQATDKGVVDLSSLDLGDSSGIDSTTEGEPSGSNQVFNVVSLTQAEYDAGTPVPTTLYLITDA